MKTPILAARLILAAAASTTLSGCAEIGGTASAPPARTTHSATATPEHVYPSGVSIVLQRGSDLYDTLPPEVQKQLCPQPVCIVTMDTPIISPISSAQEDAKPGQVLVSAGFINLINHIAHAEAIDRIQHGFLRQYARALGSATASAPPEIDNPRFWTDEVINEQQGCFNGMMETVIAINLSDNYLGYVNKYFGRTPADTVAPIHGLLTPAEWEASVTAGATNGLDAGLGTEGIKALFETIDTMPTRPAWTACVAPDNANLKKVNKLLTEVERKYFGSK